MKRANQRKCLLQIKMEGGDIRQTLTSAGPKSFNKGKLGFFDDQELWEGNIKSHLGKVLD